MAVGMPDFVAGLLPKPFWVPASIGLRKATVNGIENVRDE
jgi:hypothetical protein